MLEVEELKRSRLYRLRTSRHGNWLARLHEADRHAEVLTLLADHGYPCPRVLEASDGRRVVEVDGARYVVMEWIDGTAPWPEPDRLESMGHTLGLLHSLDIHGGVAEAGMLPRSELGFFSASLASVRAAVPRSQQGHLEALEHACAGIDLLEDMPRHLLHGDAHPWNAIAGDDGQVRFIDWDSAGLGPPIVDLGFLLLTCLGGPFGRPVEAWNESRLRAAARGYASARTLTAAERARLPAAAAFRPLVGAMAVFIGAVRHHQEVQQVWPWERYQQADRVAELALEIC
ncbi:MAG TPA: phosphotransferase [Candidatus Dormibacteraeota bacterium]|nr:phosphotransferase [Candidatus Dormibacteraeota bacterium]